MPLVTVEYPAGQLSASAKADLAEELTHVLLEIEGGADTPAGRSIAWVRFRELEGGDWFVGGKNDGSHVSPSGRYLIELNVPEGCLDQPRKTQAHQAITAAVARVAGVADEEANVRSIWVQIFEWPEGALATRGRTSALFGIAKLVGHPADHPLLDFPRAYFDAKDRWYAAAGFPETATGRALVRY